MNTLQDYNFGCNGCTEAFQVHDVDPSAMVTQELLKMADASQIPVVNFDESGSTGPRIDVKRCSQAERSQGGCQRGLATLQEYAGDIGLTVVRIGSEAYDARGRSYK